MVREPELLEWKSKFDRAISLGFETYRKHLFFNEPPWFRLLAKGFSEFLRREDVLRFMGSIRRDHMLEAGLPSVAAEVFLLWGDQDTICPPHWAQDWLSVINTGGAPPKARAWVISGAGHSVHIERPLKTARALTRIIGGRA